MVVFDRNFIIGSLFCRGGSVTIRKCGFGRIAPTHYDIRCYDNGVETGNPSQQFDSVGSALDYLALDTFYANHTVTMQSHFSGSVTITLEVVV